MPIDKVCVNLLDLPKKRLALEVIVFHGKEAALVNLALFDNGAAFAYLPVLPRDFFLGAYPFACFIKEYAAAGNLDFWLGKQLSFAENEMDTLNITLVPVLVIGVLYLLLAAVIPLIVLHFFNKGTVVERLRTSE